MKRLWFVGLCAAVICGLGATPSLADEAEGLSLMVEDEEGKEFDLFEECGENVLICFVKPDALDDENIDELAALLEEIDSGEEEAAAALRRNPGVVMVADEDEDEGEDEEGGELDVVLVIIGDEECWAQAEEAFGEEEDLTVVLASDEDEELFETFDLPEDFAWVVVLIQQGEVGDESYDSIDELKEAKEELEGALDDEE